MTDDRRTANEIDALFAAARFTKAGGIWGDAQWLQVSPQLVLSIMQDESAPFQMGQCDLHIYRAPFVAGWKITDGEAPCVNVDDCERVECKSVADALIRASHVAGVEHGQ